MLPLLVALATLAAAPFLDHLSRHRPGAEAFLDGLVQAVVPGVVLLLVLPFTFAVAGPVAVAGLVAGLALSLGLHVLPEAAPARGGLAIAALLLHALMDGGAMAAPMGEHRPLAAAVVLHVGPVGLATWRLARPRLGERGARALLLATAACMTLGYLGTDLASAWSRARPAAMALSLLAGTMLGVMQHLPPPELRREERAGLIAGLLLAVALAALGHEHGSGESATAEAVGGLLLLGLVGRRMLRSPRYAAPE